MAGNRSAVLCCQKCLLSPCEEEILPEQLRLSQKDPLQIDSASSGNQQVCRFQLVGLAFRAREITWVSAERGGSWKYDFILLIKAAGLQGGRQE